MKTWSIKLKKMPSVTAFDTLLVRIMHIDVRVLRVRNRFSLSLAISRCDYDCPMDSALVG